MASDAYLRSAANEIMIRSRANEITLIHALDSPGRSHAEIPTLLLYDFTYPGSCCDVQTQVHVRQSRQMRLDTRQRLSVKGD